MEPETSHSSRPVRASPYLFDCFIISCCATTTPNQRNPRHGESRRLAVKALETTVALWTRTDSRKLQTGQSWGSTRPPTGGREEDSEIVEEQEGEHGHQRRSWTNQETRLEKRNLLELMSNYCKVTGYKINI